MTDYLVGVPTALLVVFGPYANLLGLHLPGGGGGGVRAAGAIWAFAVGLSMATSSMLQAVVLLRTDWTRSVAAANERIGKGKKGCSAGGDHGESSMVMEGVELVAGDRAGGTSAPFGREEPKGEGAAENDEDSAPLLP